MYIVFKESDNQDRPIICIVQARDSKQAKAICGANPDSDKWAYFPTDAVKGLSDLKEGYFAKQI